MMRFGAGVALGMYLMAKLIYRGQDIGFVDILRSLI